jgi:hypothetical protein
MAPVLATAFGFAILAFAFFARPGRDERAGVFECFREPLLDRVAMVLREKSKGRGT